MKAEFGFCSICEKETAPVQNGVRRKSEQYTEVEVEWSNKSRMKIGVCVDCAVGNKHGTAYAKSGLTEAHQKYWDDMGHSYDKAVVIV